MNPIIRVLVVDDSAFIRKAVKEMLSMSPTIEVVGTARDGEEALEMVEELRPDVVTCDLQMPRCDGVQFVREQMMRRPLPILILTASPDDCEAAIEAAGAGAVDFVQKPTALANDVVMGVRERLAEKVKAASRAVLAGNRSAGDVAERRLKNWPARSGAQRRVDLVVIGISTGGPQALRQLVPQIPAGFPVPIVIVIHMPVGYTQLFAKKLDEISAIEVREAEAGKLLRAGTALIAPAGWHCLVRRAAGEGMRIELSMHPAHLPHRPAADELFRSAAEAIGDRVLGVVMTGMGSDGREGAAWIKAKGGRVLTESEESCVIYGMPRSVVEAGLSDRAVSLVEMAQAISESL